MASVAMTSRKLELTDRESSLRRLLLDVANYIDHSPPSKDADSSVSLPPDLEASRLQLRFTGGWVRDKLLGVESHDIDVAISKMTGYQFGLKMKEYLELDDHAQKYGLEKNGKGKGQGASDLHKIAANPEKSKHLETVTTRILGLDVDLVNLRKETYTEHSRNPQMEFGTPEEDALRRDATVNALFYNLESGLVEDFTGLGLQDMEKKLIRTPLEPFQTFKDDPLRVLRLIRFASRLGYSIEPAAEDCMDNADIKQALRVKISRERVGTELEKMLRGTDPRMAVALIDRMKLYTTIFSTTDHAFDPDRRWEPAYNALSTLLLSSSGKAIESVLLSDTEDRYHAWVLACFIPLNDAPDPPPEKPGRIPLPLATKVARDGIKAPNKVTDIITSAVHNLKEVISIKDRFLKRRRMPDRPLAEKEPDPAARDTLGMAVRRWGATWRSQVVYAMLFEITEAPEREQAIISDYTVFVDNLQSENLLDVHALKPMITGKDLASALNTPPGPWMKSALEEVVAWQLLHPSATDPAEAITQVKQKQGELPSRLASHFLRLTVRPLFAAQNQSEEQKRQRTHQAAVTEQGRRNITADTGPLRFSSIAAIEDETESKPWKHGKDGETGMALLRWVLEFSQPVRVQTSNKDIEGTGALEQGAKIQTKTTFLRSHWPLLIPPILTVLDDQDAHVKAQGCSLARLLLDATPPGHLAQTGLAQVFEDVLMPCLTYLPTLTPESESVALLRQAHPALRALAWARHPRRLTTTAHSTPTTAEVLERSYYRADTTNPIRVLLADANAPARTRFLDSLLRRGVLAPLEHAGDGGDDHPKLASTVLDQLPLLLEDLGIEAVKHLQRILPLLSRILGGPFVYLYPPLALAAARAVRAVLHVAWPRMEGWRWEILKGLSTLWVRIAHEEARAESTLVRQDAEDIKRELLITADTYRAVLQDLVGVSALKQELLTLVDADRRLGELFAWVLESDLNESDGGRETEDSD